MSTTPDADHRRPEGTSDAVVAAAGGVSEAFEWVERARGHLYEFHHYIGHANQLFVDAADALERAGEREAAAIVRSGVIGKDVLEGRWTFQVVEEFDAGYFHGAAAAEAAVRNQLMAGRRHVLEAEAKAEAQSTPD
jgi:uncharacterized protein YjlB